MANHKFHVMTGVVALVAALALAGPCRAQGPLSPSGSGEMVAWNLRKLGQEPLRLLKATPDAQHGQVRFLVEFTRRPELAELYDWQNRGGPVLFRFMDGEGVVMTTVRPRFEGELVPEKGMRFRLLLQMPDEQTLALTRSVLAD